jgi:hypothetical protein
MNFLLSLNLDKDVAGFSKTLVPVYQNKRHRVLQQGC